MLTEHFNKLTPIEHEALTKLFEEASEINQAIAKIMLHGIDSYEPGGGMSNQEKLENELGDLMFFMEIAAQNGVIRASKVAQAMQRRAKRTTHYLHHVEIE